MAKYAVRFARSARKELENLPAHAASRILEKIESLAENPRLRGTIKLQGRGNFWRARVGDYRVIYSIDDSTKVVDVSVIRHRRDVYRDL
jgi:mRNA interferase RelE/StbE